VSSQIHPKAKIGEGCKIGPNVIIDEHVEIGPDCEIRANAVLTGHTKIGARNQIGYGAIIGAEPQDLGFKGGVSYVEIGDENVIREYATIHRGTKEESSTVLGNKNFLMAGAHVAHNCRIGNHVILVNNVLLAGYVDVADRAFLGGAVVVHQFTRIGELVMVRGQTRIGLDIPPYFMAVDTNTVAGVNRVGLRRNGYGPAQRRVILKVYEWLYEAGLNRLQAVEAIRRDVSLQTPEAERICEFVVASRRGISRPGKKKKESPEEEDSDDLG
jgi:UDP-N-acetylglucosamine acyltransferase